MEPEHFIQTASLGDEAEARRAAEVEPRLAAARNQAGVSVIAVTVCAGRMDLARELARHRNELDLFEAACIGSVDLVNSLLRSNPDRIDQHGPDGFSALGFAAYFGHFDLLDFLIQSGADLELPSANRLRARPLHSAAAPLNKHHSTAAASILLEAGADPNSQQRSGYTALHAAVRNEDIELARVLIAFGANPHVSNDEGDSALQLACAAQATSMIQLIEENFHCR